MVKRRDGSPPLPIGWGCLVVAILLAVLGVGFAVIFLWDVNSPH
ncbi:hypothetical protein BH09PSE1_BH09PSE1_23880 [soil metagenome]